MFAFTSSCSAPLVLLFDEFADQRRGSWERLDQVWLSEIMFNGGCSYQRQLDLWCCCSQLNCCPLVSNALALGPEASTHRCPACLRPGVHFVIVFKFWGWTKDNTQLAIFCIYHHMMFAVVLLLFIFILHGSRFMAAKNVSLKKWAFLESRRCLLV